jgi:hypothetical protein
MRDNKQGPNPLASQSSRPAAERYWAARTIGISIFIGFDIAFLGYLLTFTLWWFLLPVLAFVLAWRYCFRAWPFLGSSPQ